ncbi:MAG: hypothetical protein AAF500_05210 [Myxococcota bacterium]
MLSSRLWCRVALIWMLAAGCGDGGTSVEPTRWLLAPSDPLPSRLSEVGLFTDMTAREPYDDLVPYSPKHVLYSNGLAKERQLYLPDSASIDVEDDDQWVFPEGTVLVKTFVFEGVPIETRLIFRNDEDWDYAIYRWSEDAGDADRLEGNWAEERVAVGDEGLPHTLPSRLDCRTCHETHEAVTDSPVLGVGRYQTDDRLVDAGVFAGEPQQDEVEGRTDEETSALSYFIGNCTSCHNGGEALNSSFSLYPDDAVNNTVDRPTSSETGQGIRVVPGNPAGSVLFVTVVEAGDPSYRGPFKVMPPIGVDTTDASAEAVLGDWIQSL